jgi:biopolymer transport protein ExbD
VRLASRRRHEAEITLTPLIDILFIVLLFLVLTATFTEQTVLRLALPRADTADRLQAPGETVRILVDADGGTYLDDQARTLDEIAIRLRAVVNKDEALVRLSADERTGHGRVVQVMDVVRQAGLHRVDIETVSGVRRDGPP